MSQPTQPIDGVGRPQFDHIEGSALHADVGYSARRAAMRGLVAKATSHKKGTLESGRPHLARDHLVGQGSRYGVAPVPACKRLGFQRFRQVVRM